MFNRDVIRDTLGSLKSHEWLDIEQLAQAVEQRLEATSPETLQTAMRLQLKAEIRRVIRREKDETGGDAWASIELQNEEGKTVHVYKQVMLFDPKNYLQTIGYWEQKREYAKRKKGEYRKRFLATYPTEAREQLGLFEASTKS